MKKTVYAGTYTSTGSRGIYSFSFDEGVLSDLQVFAQMKNPKYIGYEDGKVISIIQTEAGAGAAILNSEGEILDQLIYESDTSCYIGKYGNRIYTANYHEGTFTALEVTEDDHLKLIGTVLIREGAGCHMVLVHNDSILVPCLFLDRVMIFDTDLNKKGSIRFNHGTGPRHGVFTKDGEYLYLVSELSNELFIIRTDGWQVVSSISVLPGGEKNQRDTAAVRLSEDEKYVYVSTRTKDIISVIEMNEHVPSLKQTVSCGGRHPRDFILCDGYLLSANRFSNTVTAFRLNEDGTVGEETGSIMVTEPVSLAVKE